MHEVVNLFPWRDVYRRFAIVRLVGMLMALIGGSLVSIYLPYAWYQHTSQDMESRQLQWQQKLHRQQPIYAKWQNISKHDQHVERTFKTLSQRIRRHNQPMILMNVVPSLLPQETQLDSMRWFQQQVEIVGRTDNKAALGAIVTAFQTVEPLTSIALSSVMVTQKEPVAHIFKLSIGFTREDDDESH
ncbi:PilN domain-containing protein [Vibrio zhugei]|uniref:PilN domain-containing protein n=1 Tax=Vibrio zhugei TaxID=2479546 RepID=A0ABV7C6K2_9VIBR|nr:hypothetical protein [Vibrio zhugei]